MEKNLESEYYFLKFFLANKYRIGTDEITLQAGLEKDLGIYGDEAVELLQDYSEIFKVDIANFNFTAYFSEEGCDIFALFRKKKKVKELLVKDLIKGIEMGKLDDSVIGVEYNSKGNKK